MKPVTAILLLVIHVFNMGGYRILFDQLEKKASIQLVQQLDNEQYRDDQLIEMKVPLPMPYQTNWADFERYNGEIEISGVHYNYVKRKVYNDTLILLCIPNQGKMKLNSAKEQFFSLVNDITTDNKTPLPIKSSALKTITSEYQDNRYEIAFSCPASMRSEFIMTHSSIPPQAYLGELFQPPRA
jgi:hypothetical protein